ncbi:hypothetical protein MPTK1_4g00150 [Marchantia polymorpha subsp. ruderalis]|nr:hypothetical protein MARPO_0162s0006 [Marchantia polymorpha]BBN07004.1 hypothetical protein Mp_4g00150 [Marchantia polymorpha subsp. ruderalis]|eukprot:PTQ28473.1 hypothetical protein MARPO_0162s0006 [Marchantia polymorpha]
MPPLAVSHAFPSAQFGFPLQIPYGDYDVGNNAWGVRKSSSLYRVEGWGAPYFRINEKGNIAARPHGRGTFSSDEIDVMDVVERAVSEGMSMPLIIRFPEILKHRLSTLHMAFERGIEHTGYQGRFQGVFPVKCNPDRYIVEDIVRHGKQYNFGLEAGSKPELVMAMTNMCHGSADALLICNGYKDAEYVRLALMARQIGLKSIIVLEQEEELDIVIKVSKEMEVFPVIGVRAKLCTKHGGHWGETSGEKGKFGLTTSEIVGVVAKLKRNNMLASLQLLHFHIGSQIPSLALVDEGVSEAAHIFCELELMGANMKNIDIGGGLGVDYDGSHSSASEMSVGYTLEEYAEHVVNAIKEACSLKNVKNPTISCESGRGLVSHQSILVFDVLSARMKTCDSEEDIGVSLDFEGWPRELAATHEQFTELLKRGDYVGALEHARTLKAEGVRLFKIGQFSLERRALTEKLFDMVSNLAVQREEEKFDRYPTKKLSLVDSGVVDQTATYHINLSIFKSMLDSWAIGQLFPILPMHRLDEEPTVRAVLSDLTCDSDGKIARFIGHNDDVEPSNFLRVHGLISKKPYYLGVFLGGAYQEVMGSMHNLFGGPNMVQVTFREGGFEITHAIPTQNIEDALRTMQHEPHQMVKDLRNRVEDSLRQGRFKNRFEADVAGDYLASSFKSSTYLASDYRGGCAYAANKANSICVPVEQAHWCT